MATDADPFPGVHVPFFLDAVKHQIFVVSLQIAKGCFHEPLLPHRVHFFERFDVGHDVVNDAVQLFLDFKTPITEDGIALALEFLVDEDVPLHVLFDLWDPIIQMGMKILLCLFEMVAMPKLGIAEDGELVLLAHDVWMAKDPGGIAAVTKAFFVKGLA